MLRPVHAPFLRQICRSDKARIQDVGSPSGGRWGQTQPGWLAQQQQVGKVGRLHVHHQLLQTCFDCHPAQACKISISMMA